MTSHSPLPANGKSEVWGGSGERPRAAAGGAGGVNGLRARRACGKHNAAKERQKEKANFFHDVGFLTYRVEQDLQGKTCSIYAIKKTRSKQRHVVGIND
jgi:hypothetical protein